MALHRAWVGLLVLVLLSGCFRAAENVIDDARNASSDTAPQESVEAPTEETSVTDTSSNVTADAPTPTTTPSEATPSPSVPTPTPTPALPPPGPTPTPPPSSTPSPTPAPSPSPSPSPAPPPSPPPTVPTATPTPTPTPTPTTWPTEGSYVKYRVFSGSSCPDSCWFQERYANASWTFRNGDWVGSCDEHIVEYWQYNDTWDDRTRHVTYSAAAPPHWPPFDTKTPPAVGTPIWYLEGCDITSVDYQVYNGTSTQSVSVRGQTTTVATFQAADNNDGSPNDFESEWRRDSGLVLSWSWYQRNTAHWGGVTDMG